MGVWGVEEAMGYLGKEGNWKMGEYGFLIHFLWEVKKFNKLIFQFWEMGGEDLKFVDEIEISFWI